MAQAVSDLRFEYSHKRQEIYFKPHKDAGNARLGLTYPDFKGLDKDLVLLNSKGEKNE